MDRLPKSFNKETFTSSPQGHVNAKIYGEPDFFSNSIIRQLHADPFGNEQEEIVAFDDHGRILGFYFQPDIPPGTYKLTDVDKPIPTGMVFFVFAAGGSFMKPLPAQLPNSITFNTAGGERNINALFTFIALSFDGSSHAPISGDFNIEGFSEI